MSLYSLFGTNETAELDGFELILFDEDVEIKFTLARAGGSNKRFANRLQALLQKAGNLRQIRNIERRVVALLFGQWALGPVRACLILTNLN